MGFERNPSAALNGRGSEGPWLRRRNFSPLKFRVSRNLIIVKSWSLRLSARTLAFHAGKTGSIPVGTAKRNTTFDFLGASMKRRHKKEGRGHATRKRRAQKKERKVSWRAAEHEYVEKDVSWHWLVGTLTVILMLVALWQKNFFFFIFLVIATPMIFFFGKRKPRVITFTVREDLVQVGDRHLLHYSDLEGYAVLEREGFLDVIILKKKTHFNPYVRILVDSETREKAEDILADHLDEVDYEQSFLDIVSEWMGF